MAKTKAADIRAALVRRFPSPECALVFEVANATGANVRRHLDAVAMELWPSRGLALHGIEIKVDRYDWRREKANPEKAEEIARFCDYFWIAAPAGLVPVEEMPLAWGLLELSGDLLGVKKPVQKTEAAPAGRPFLAAMLRAAGRGGLDPEGAEAILQRRIEQQDRDFEERVKIEAERSLGRRRAGEANWAELAQAVGEIPDSWLRDSEIIEAVRMVLKTGAASTFSGMQSLQKSLSEANDKVAGALRDLGVEPVKPAGRRRRRGAKAP